MLKADLEKAGTPLDDFDLILFWIETAKEFGRTIPEPKGRRLQYA